MLSIVIPTYNEKKNIEKLIPQIHRILSKESIKYEIIIVDDNSPDKTAEAAKKLGKKYPVKVIKRKGKLGLSSAVVAGFKKALGDFLGVMDADLSHPVDKLPEMFKELKTHDMVVGSRYVKGGDIENWPIKRKIISKGATLLAKPVTKMKDPMSGFFMIKRSVLKIGKLNPRGYKIALEVYVKSNVRIFKEVPIIFKDREEGTSKLGGNVMVNYLIHLAQLYRFKIRR